ncbi:MAG: hypothetical protein EOP56_06655 [Sphingobacteriales bacterium]|nr:MAG: hypothetical protein EOP56_06655 [Sphingobacteriales bacterium]
MTLHDQDKPTRQPGLPTGIPTTDEAERSELSDRMDQQIIKDHLSDSDRTPFEKKKDDEEIAGRD